MRFPLAPTALAAGLAGLALLGPAAPLRAQDAPVAAPAELTLDEAVRLARRYNPTFRATENNVRAASAGVMAARGAFLPAVDASFGTSWREGRPQFFGGQRFGAASNTIATSYDVGVVSRLGLATFTSPALARANVRAAEAEVTGGAEQLRTGVTQQYIAALRAEAVAALQDTLLATTRAQLELARARQQVGAGTQLDVQRAQVQVGTQEIALIRSRSEAEVAKLRLFQQMGVAAPGPVRLTSRLTVAPMPADAGALVEQARRANPGVEALRARERASQLGLKNARAQYTPTLSLRTGLGGFTNKITDGAFVDRQTCDVVPGCNTPADLTPDQLAFGRSGNQSFPFDFTRSPLEVSAFVSLPIFNGFQREQQIQEAAVQRDDARFQVRGRELQLEADVRAAYLELATSQRTVALQEQNAGTAREVLRFAEERYRVGAATFLDVTQARSEYERAETDRVAAIYDYHRAFAQLEAAVGRPLR